MSETKHTPGPWHISDQTERDGLPSVLIHAPPEGLLAIVRVGHQGGYYGDANARLIASAPDMLEALQELADLMDDIRTGEYTPDSFTTQPARAVIAKATGEAS